MAKDTADYEKSEEIAIESGKKALANANWLFDRKVAKTKGFFVELRENDKVHPEHYSVHCVDGNGTKLFLSAWGDSYRKAPIDGVAMNANDMATIIHASPDIINIYMACQTMVEENYMDEIMVGFIEALEKVRVPNHDINIGKIETASLDEMISLGVPNMGIDFGIVMIGYIDKNKVPNLNPKPGNYIVGVSSTGMHSNGFTGARHVLLKPDYEYRKEWRSQYKGKFALIDRPSILEGQTVEEALSEPTAIYFQEANEIGRIFDNLHIYGINITGNGLMNFNRAGEYVIFDITDPLPLLPIHKLLIQCSHWDPSTSYKKQNNGMGFAYIAPNLEIAEGIVDIINKKGDNRAKVVGKVSKSKNKEPRTIMHKPYEGPPLDFVGYSS